MSRKTILFAAFLTMMTMLPCIAMAEIDNLGLDDVIEILQVLTGGHQAPTFNATGTWSVQSSPDGNTRTGEVFLDMTPDGKITGYAELTSLQGLSSVSGQVQGLSFTLEMISEFGSIVAHGAASADGQNINGIFHFKDNVDFKISWDGYRKTTAISNGTYVYDSENNKLILTFDLGPMEYNITEFTETTVKLSNQTWERNVPGDVGNFIGVWRNNAASTETIMTFKDDGSFSLIQIVSK
jgi:hypothetical protein